MKSFIAVAVAVVAGAVGGSAVANHLFHRSPAALFAAGLAITLAVAAAEVAAFGRTRRPAIPAREA